MDMVARVKVCDPVKVPANIAAEINDLRFRLDRRDRELAQSTLQNEQLCLDNERLRLENERLRQEIERLRQNNLPRTDEQLRQENERLRQEIEQLRQQRDQAQRQSKRQAAPFSKGGIQPRPKRPGRKKGPDHGKHGHRQPPQPDQVDEVLDAPLPAACPGCGCAVKETEVRSQFQTEIPRRPLVRQFNVHIGCCDRCGTRVQGRHPLQTSDALGAASAQLGPDAQAAVVMLNKRLGLSHGKVVEAFESLFGIHLTRGASAQIVLRAGRRLGPADKEAREALKGSERLVPDETGWRVGGKSAWLHVWVGDKEIVYHIAPGRGADSLQDVIGLDWAGDMTHDGWASYGRFGEAGHQQCLGHVLRRAEELELQAKGGAVHYPRRLIALLTGAIHLRNQHLKGEVTLEQLQEARKRFDEQLEKLARPAREVPAYERLSGHLRNHMKEWFAFLDDPRIEPTNWQAEQAIRPAVVNRKVWGGNRTWVGAGAQQVLMTVVETCRRAQQSPLDFVSATLRAFGNPCLARPILVGPR